MLVRDSRRIASMVWASFMVLVMTVTLAACGAATTEPAETDDSEEAKTPVIRVVTTSNIVADWAKAVGGQHVEVTALEALEHMHVESLLEEDVDPHTFQPGPQDAANIANADLILAIGLGMEQLWLGELLENVAQDPAIILYLGEVDGIEPLEVDPEGGIRTRPRGDFQFTYNPHFWFDPLRVTRAVDGIADRFATLDPENADAYRANAGLYNKLLEALDGWIVEQVSVLPAERRLLLSSHDSYRYLADRYEFEVVGVILSVSTGVEPSAEHLAQLVEVIKERNVAVVFGETIVDQKLAKALADEAGVKFAPLYSDSVGGEGSGAETYIGLMRENVVRIVEALQ